MATGRITGLIRFLSSNLSRWIRPEAKLSSRRSEAEWRDLVFGFSPPHVEDVIEDDHSTVTDLVKFLGRSTSSPRCTAM